MLWFHIKIRLESTGIIKTTQRLESVRVLRHRFWSVGPCIVIKPIRGRRTGGVMTLPPYNQLPRPSLGFGFWLDYFVYNSFAIIRL